MGVGLLVGGQTVKRSNVQTVKRANGKTVILSGARAKHRGVEGSPTRYEILQPNSSASSAASRSAQDDPTQRTIQGTSKNSSHEVSAESFPSAHMWALHKISSRRVNYARGILFRLTKNILDTELARLPQHAEYVEVP